MFERNAIDFWDRRLPLYGYLEPLWTGRKVLEIGCGSGVGSEYLAAHGASRVVSVDIDPAQIERHRARYRRANLEFRSVAHVTDLTKLAEAFDVILVPDADAHVRRAEVISAWKRALAEGGRLIVSVSSADRPGTPGSGAPAGVGYYELTDALAPHFPHVQMFGQTPFVGFGMTEFDAASEGMRIDSRLLEGNEGETATNYIAVAGAEAWPPLGYSLVQTPFAPLEARLTRGVRDDDPGPAEARREAAERRLDEVERKGRARQEEADGRISELRRRLDDATVQSESSMRIARAQGEEIEELRARLRRTAEDRGLLDGELGKLRRALAEADESVLSLTRRTTEEMTAVAERLAIGLRPPEETSAGRGRLSEYAALRDEADQLRASLAETEARAAAAERRLEESATAGRDRDEEVKDLRGRLRRAEDAVERERQQVAALQERLKGASGELKKLEEREDALLGRDERIARLEGEKQDLIWRTSELEEKLRNAIARTVKLEGARAAGGGVPSEEVTAVRAARDRSIGEFHRASAAHVDEVTRLQASVAEQASLVSELEDGLAAAEARANAAAAESATLRRNSKELEEADRARRSRLAELEGKLLRLEHEKKATAQAAHGTEDLERKLQLVETERETLRAERDALRGRLGERESEVARLDAALAGAASAQVAHRETTNGKELGAPALPAGTLEELTGIERDLRQEMQTLSQIEARIESELRDARQRQSGGGDGGAGGDATEVILLHTTLSNFRRRAARLRDEIEGCRRRIESLSAAELAGFLEELGEDLAEFAK